jgi:hypothetical protein
MTLRCRSIAPAVLLVGLCTAGCMQKKDADVSSSATPPPAPVASTPATASTTPQASPAGTAAAPATTLTTATASGPAAATGAEATVGSPTPSADANGVVDTASKQAAAQWVLRQDEIKHDPDGQWAVSATASSSYGNAVGDASWSAQQAAGEPNVAAYADDGHAWAPKTQDGGIEWLDLEYAKPVHASEVRIRESMGSGAVVKVELFDEAGAAHLLWTGNDPTIGLNYLILKLAPTDYKTKRVKVTLATNIIPGWNEIDAVQLVGKP